MIFHVQERNTVADAMLKVLIRYLFIVFVCSACKNTTEYTGIFSDGLPEPNKTEIFDLSDEQYGVERVDTFYVDINNNQKPDTITKGHFITGTAHAYTFYNITLDDGTKLDELRTIEGADCVLQAYKFSFKPFMVMKTSRQLGNDYIEPTKAKLETFKMNTNRLDKISEKNYNAVCDVRSLL